MADQLDNSIMLRQWLPQAVTKQAEEQQTWIRAAASTARDDAC